jgi:predicted transcriptional regulator
MACISPDGQLTDAARKILTALQKPGTVEAVSQETGLPLFRIRASIREIVDADLLEERDGQYVMTDKGAEVLALG